MKQEDIQLQLKKNFIILQSGETPYLYFDETNVELASNNGELSKEDIVVKYYNNVFTLSDLCIVEAVAKLSFAERYLIRLQLIRDKKEDSEKLISDAADITKDDILRNRLNILTKCSILRRFKFVSRTGGIKTYYCCTAHGYNYLKRILNRKDGYDEYISVTPIDEVLKYLSANTVGLIASNSKNCKGMYAKNAYFSKETGKVDLYNELVYEKNEKKRYILLEPFFMQYQKGRLTTRSYEKFAADRVKLVKSYISSKNSELPAVVVFLCENMEGIYKLAEHLNKNFKENLSRFYFTTDYLVFSNQDFNSSLFKVEIENNQLVWQLADLDM